MPWDFDFTAHEHGAKSHLPCNREPRQTGLCEDGKVFADYLEDHGT